MPVGSTRVAKIVLHFWMLQWIVRSHPHIQPRRVVRLMFLVLPIVPTWVHLLFRWHAYLEVHLLLLCLK